jgi:hypothetical protein
MVKYTIYRTPNGPRIGLTFEQTPSLTYIELLDLIQDLNRAERQMREYRTK